MTLYGNTALPVNIVASGNNAIVTPATGRGVLVRQIVLQANALATVTFKAGTTALSGPMSYSAGGGINHGGPDSSYLIWDTGINNAFIIHLQIGFLTNVGGWIIYEEYD